jgi:hypothetical protein
VTFVLVTFFFLGIHQTPWFGVAFLYHLSPALIRTDHPAILRWMSTRYYLPLLAVACD